MLDLPTLGRELRERRKALRIRSAELARRIGVSQTYIWLIEQARPRERGEPSRPSEELLIRWTAALGMNEDESRRIRALAGYFDPDLPSSAPPSRIQPSSPSPAPPMPAAMPPPPPTALTALSGAQQTFAANAAVDQWAERAQGTESQEGVTQRMEEIMATAEQHGRGEEAKQLLRSFLDWLEFRVRGG